MKYRRLKFALLMAFAGGGISWAQHVHSYTNGICSNVDGLCNAVYQEPAQDGDYYLLANAGNVEWFASQVNGGRYGLKAKLTADIDYEGKTHTPIGTDFAVRFDGVFDGQGHKITNLTMNQSGYVGFFGSLGGPNGAQIKNLTIGSTCSFTSTSSHVGAFAGITYYADATNTGVIRFQNCVNEAAVSSEKGCVAGFIGAGQGSNGYCALRFENCANKGAISTSAKRCAAFMLNSSNNVALINCYNSGLLTGVKNNNNGGWGYNNLCEPTSEKKVTLTNCYDVSKTTNRGQGTAKDAATMASGELCYLLNGDQSNVQWYQIVGSGSPIPSVISGGQVFAHGSQYCDGTPAGAATVYNNEGPNEFINLGHDYVNGICSRDCTEKYQPAEKDGEGWYLIANVGNLEWYAAFVNKGSGNNYKSAKLTADIDFAGTNVTHTTIGQGDSNKYSASFDGQGHSIKNMVIYKPENDRIGLFGVIRGSNAHISNIVIESSCSFTGKNYVGAIAGCGWRTDAPAAVISNCANFAPVTATDGDAGGIFGAGYDAKPVIGIENCLNAGTITANYAAAFCGYNDKADSYVRNCLNIGTIVSTSSTENLARFNGSTMTLTNVYDYSDTESITQGDQGSLSPGALTNGQLCYVLNGDQSKIVWKQNLSGTVDAHPVLDGEHGQVYQNYKSGSNGQWSNTNGATVASMTLTDMADYVADANFTAESLTYDRTLAAGGYHSLCLPFAVTTEMLGSGSKLFTLSAVGQDAVTLTGTTSVAAGTPCFASVTSDFNFGTMSNVAMVKDVDNSGTVKGTFTNQTIGAGFYKLSSDGTYFGLTTDGATATAFRSYITEGGGSVKTLNILLSDGTSITTALSEEQPKVIYDLSGRRVEKATKGLYIINGKKVMK